MLIDILISQLTTQTKRIRLTLTIKIANYILQVLSINP